MFRNISLVSKAAVVLSEIPKEKTFKNYVLETSYFTGFRIIRNQETLNDIIFSFM